MDHFLCASISAFSTYFWYNSGHTCAITDSMYVCMAITYSKSMDHPDKVVNPVRGQRNRENEYFPFPGRA